MSREVVHEARVWCDGCGYACLEATAEYIDEAVERCAWHTYTSKDNGARIDLCPTCKPRSPDAQVQRARDAAAAVTVYPGGYADGWYAAMRHILNALDGDQ